MGYDNSIVQEKSIGNVVQAVIAVVLGLFLVFFLGVVFLCFKKQKKQIKQKGVFDLFSKL